jgi:PPM family protein phosphatase
MLRVAEHFEKSDTGLARKANEDNFFVRAPLFVVADGMGGAQAGEVASRVAAETFSGGLPDGGSNEERLAARVLEANSRIHRLSQEDRERAGMGTTLTAAYVDADEIALAHVGDSRAYLWRDGELTRLTRDHSLVDELVRRGKLTEEEAAEHPQRSIITRALGPEPDVEVDTRTYRAADGDVLLLCSDGLTSMLPEQRIAELLAAAPGLGDAGRALVDAANAAGGRDNITVVLFRLEDVPAGVAGAGGAPRTEEVRDGAVAAKAQPTTEVHAAAGGQATGRGAEAGARGRAQAGVGGRAAAGASGRPLTRAQRKALKRAQRADRPLPLRVKLFAATVATVIVLAVLVVAGMFATRAVFFVGTDDRGMVTVYRGLPFELPVGIKLYSEYSISGVPAATVPPARRDQLLDHRLRSREDVRDLVHELELGNLSP